MLCFKKNNINKNWGTQSTRNDTCDGTQCTHYDGNATHSKQHVNL